MRFVSLTSANSSSPFVYLMKCSCFGHKPPSALFPSSPNSHCFQIEFYFSFLASFLFDYRVLNIISLFCIATSKTCE